jgi:hypothetical protein
LYSSWFCHSSIWASTWLVNDVDITNDECPVALPRFTSRPSESRMTGLVGQVHEVDLRLDVGPLVLAQRGRLDLGVEVADVAQDRVVLHRRTVLAGDHVMLPVAVTKMSASGDRSPPS